MPGAHRGNGRQALLHERHQLDQKAAAAGRNHDAVSEDKRLKDMLAQLDRLREGLERHKRPAYLMQTSMFALMSFFAWLLASSEDQRDSSKKATAAAASYLPEACLVFLVILGTCYINLNCISNNVPQQYEEANKSFDEFIKTFFQVAGKADDIVKLDKLYQDALTAKKESCLITKEIHSRGGMLRVVSEEINEVYRKFIEKLEAIYKISSSVGEECENFLRSVEKDTFAEYYEASLTAAEDEKLEIAKQSLLAKVAAEKDKIAAYLEAFKAADKALKSMQQKLKEAGADLFASEKQQAEQAIAALKAKIEAADAAINEVSDKVKLAADIDAVRSLTEPLVKVTQPLEAEPISKAIIAAVKPLQVKFNAWLQAKSEAEATVAVQVAEKHKATKLKTTKEKRSDQVRKAKKLINSWLDEVEGHLTTVEKLGPQCSQASVFTRRIAGWKTKLTAADAAINEVSAKVESAAGIEAVQSLTEPLVKVTQLLQKERAAFADVETQLAAAKQAREDAKAWAAKQVAAAEAAVAAQAEAKAVAVEAAEEAEKAEAAEEAKAATAQAAQVAAKAAGAAQAAAVKPAAQAATVAAPAAAPAPEPAPAAAPAQAAQVAAKAARAQAAAIAIQCSFRASSIRSKNAIAAAKAATVPAPAPAANAQAETAVEAEKAQAADAEEAKAATATTASNPKKPKKPTKQQRGRQKRDLSKQLREQTDINAAQQSYIKVLEDQVKDKYVVRANVQGILEAGGAITVEEFAVCGGVTFFPQYFAPADAAAPAPGAKAADADAPAAGAPGTPSPS